MKNDRFRTDKHTIKAIELLEEERKQVGIGDWDCSVVVVARLLREIARLKGEQS